ncbi:Nramp family divalent metal transporter [Parapedobacter indicus]|uniref:Mn2+ and Fe2+ transporters of the NRAMP family n=1 Tax=Parapedobacter indicus TaxID=1477437 RepID=A0A1I3FR98_9SPHI|nr:Nramp family divalent metal transporter [Parapedobacter indicus]PPL03849.1 Mn2+/Fe2+ NRAMP family transporter [Parapedobacter indicus]SFI13704.1 Mn2+ and Fe2+ transporters of the NRAMP family [Parapedobacter indicus]
MPRIRNFFLALAPGIVTAAIVFGPSKITITSKMGAMYSYSLLWLVAVAIFFMIIYVNIASRIGLATDDSLLVTIRKHYGKWASGLIGFGIFMVATSFQAGNSIGVGLSIAEASGTSMAPWIILFNAIGIALLFFRDFYKVLERLMITIVMLMLFAFITTMFLAKPSVSGMVSGLVPEVPEGSLGLLIAFFASCFSVVGAFYQTYLIQARKKASPTLVIHASRGTGGMIVLGLMCIVVIMCAAAVLHEQNIAVNKASDMAKALEPLFGSAASYLFLIGLFGASFSSVVGNATIGGTLLSDGLGYGSSLDSKVVKGLIAAVMVIGSVIAIGYEKPPLEMIVLAQSVTIFLVPFIAVVMYLLANNQKLMGQYTNSLFVRIAGLIGLIVLVVLAVYNFNELFLK